MISKWMQGSRTKLYFYKKMFGKVSHVSSVGNEAIEDFVNTFDYPRHKISTIRRGIPVKAIDKESARKKLREMLGLPAGVKIVMHVGNFSPEKNHKFLLEIFDKMKIEHPDIKLVFVGDGILFPEIQQSVKEKELQDTVFLTGFRKDIPQFLAGADCFALASKVEGVPGVILEAGIQKVPAVSTNVGGVYEVLKNGDTGFMVDNFNKEEFYDKLVLLTMNSKLKCEMGWNAYELVINEFGTEINARKFEQLYLNLVREHVK